MQLAKIFFFLITCALYIAALFVFFLLCRPTRWEPWKLGLRVKLTCSQDFAMGGEGSELRMTSHLIIHCI